MLAVTLLAALAAATPSSPDCQSAMGDLFGEAETASVPGQVDGASLGSANDLAALREARGDALIVIQGGRFAGADFGGMRLSNICFVGTDLSGSNWRGAQAPGVAFVGVDLSGASLAGAHMARVLFRHPNLAQVDATGADFSGGRLDGGWDGSLESLRLDRANLRGFRFECGITLGDGCPLERSISFRGADLSGAVLNSYWGAGEDDWTGARLDRTVIGLHQVEEAIRAQFAGPVILRGGDASVELSSEDVRTAAAHIRPSEEAAAPSFDCARAATPVERLICGDQGSRLRALDRLVADLFRQAAVAGPGAAADQRAWLADRDRCARSEDVLSCVDALYMRRREQLVARIGPPAWVRTERVALFVMPVVDFDDGFRADPLFRRLLPVIDGGAWGAMAVRVGTDGSLAARGESIGANAHMCSLSADGLWHDPATGWYSAMSEAEPDDPPQWRGRPAPVLLFWNDRAAVYRHGHAYGGGDDIHPRAGDYASCGARAGFTELVRMPVSEEQVAEIFEALGETP